MFTATIRFYAGLNHFLPPNQRQKPIEHAFDGRVAIKDMIEACNVPHPEVDLILVNGESVDFYYLVEDGDRISVYPSFHALDIENVTQLRPEWPAEARFVLDVHLGRLASYLRGMGFDTLYPENYDDDYLAALAGSEERIMLTRDRGLLKRSVVTYGYYVRATQPRAQVVEVLRRFRLADQVQPFRRCAQCNGLLENVTKETVWDRLQPATREHYDEFQRCVDCDQLYWRGSHYERMQQFIADVLAEVRAEE